MFEGMREFKLLGVYGDLESYYCGNCAGFGGVFTDFIFRSYCFDTVSVRDSRGGNRAWARFVFRDYLALGNFGECFGFFPAEFVGLDSVTLSARDGGGEEDDFVAGSGDDAGGDCGVVV